MISKVACVEEDTKKIDGDQSLKCNKPWIQSTGESEDQSRRKEENQRPGK